MEDVPYYPLFDFKSNKQTHTRELLDIFAKSKGYKFTYLPLPIKRFERWLLEERIDFKYPDNERWHGDKTLKEKFYFSKSTLKLVAGTSVLPNFLNKDPKALKSVGTLLGFYPTTWIKRIKSGQVTLHEEVSTRLLVRQILNKHIDSIDIEPSVIRYYLKQLNQPMNAIVIDKRFRYDVYDYHLSTIKYPTIIKEFNLFLKNNQPLLKQLNKKYNIFDYKPYLK